MVSFTWSLPYSTAFNSVPRDFKNQDMVNFSGKQLSETAVYGCTIKKRFKENSQNIIKILLAQSLLVNFRNFT